MSSRSCRNHNVLEEQATLRFLPESQCTGKTSHTALLTPVLQVKQALLITKLSD